MMQRVLSVFAVAVGLGLATGSARAQYVAPPASIVRSLQAPSYTPGTYYFSNGHYYYSPVRVTTSTSAAAAHSVHNGVTRGPTGAMTGRTRHTFDPSGRPVQLHKPWLQPLR
jgi:hypothetical protein